MLGEVPATFIHEQSERKSKHGWPAQVNCLMAHGGFDLVLPLGQRCPQKVIGMANYKQEHPDRDGRDSINRSHCLGAVYDMVRIMGRAENLCAVFSGYCLSW